MSDSMHTRQQKYVDILESLNGGAVSRVTWEKIYRTLDNLSEGLPLVIKPLSTDSKIGRGRILHDAEKFLDIAELSYPSKEKCKAFGRCHRPGNPVFYGGVGTELILSEIGAQVGDYVGLLHVSPVRDLLCVQLGAVDLWRRSNGELPVNEDIKTFMKAHHRDPNNIVMFILDAFFRDCFSRQAGDVTYKLTSAISSVIMDAHSNISGLIYDSVDHTAGACIAIKPEVADKFLKPTEVQIIKITSYLGYGIYDFEQIAFANKFDEKQILWS